MPISKEQVTARIHEAAYVTVGVTTMVCVTLDNGFTAVGTSACANPAEFDEKLGRKYALDNALETLLPYIAFLQMEDAHRAKVAK